VCLCPACSAIGRQQVGRAGRSSANGKPWWQLGPASTLVIPGQSLHRNTTAPARRDVVQEPRSKPAQQVPDRLLALASRPVAWLMI
jgi:hypothetical protein